ncbi:hypothetical protein D9M72_528840 [compost metagenome]
MAFLYCPAVAGSFSSLPCSISTATLSALAMTPGGLTVAPEFSLSFTQRSMKSLRISPVAAIWLVLPASMIDFQAPAAIPSCTTTPLMSG